MTIVGKDMKNMAKNSNATADAVNALTTARKSEPVTPDVVMDAKSLVNQVRDDMGNAELGDFCRLRAGVGLLRFRELNPHGEWMTEMTAAFPGRSPRTLQRYMQQAAKFIGQLGVGVEAVHTKMMAFNVETLRAQIGLPEGERKQLPERGVSKSVAIDNKITNAVVAYSAGEKPEVQQPHTVRISKEEEMQTRVDYAMAMASKVQIWNADARTIRTLPTETLESVRSILVLTVDSLKNELRSREAAK